MTVAYELYKREREGEENTEIDTAMYFWIVYVYSWRLEVLKKASEK
jgi:hypothetical protein